MPTKEAKGVANFLYSIFCCHGVPKRIQSDQGREFVNSLNQHLFQLTGVQHIISTAYHPQTNGLDECFNQTLQRSLMKMIDDNQTKLMFRKRQRQQKSKQKEYVHHRQTILNVGITLTSFALHDCYM